MYCDRDEERFSCPLLKIDAGMHLPVAVVLNPGKSLSRLWEVSMYQKAEEVFSI